MSLQESPAPAQPRRGGIDRVVALAVLAFTAAVYGLTFRFDEVPAALMSGMGADLFPRLVLATLAVLAVLMAFNIGPAPMATPAPVPRHVWATAAALVGFMGGVELAGMWASSFVLLAGLGWYWGERSLWRLAASAGGTVVVLYLLFTRFLGVSFPRSLLGGLIWP